MKRLYLNKSCLFTYILNYREEGSILRVRFWLVVCRAVRKMSWKNNSIFMLRYFVMFSSVYICGTDLTVTLYGFLVLIYQFYADAFIIVSEDLAVSLFSSSFYFDCYPNRSFSWQD